MLRILMRGLLAARAASKSVNLQRPARATVCSHSYTDTVAKNPTSSSLSPSAWRLLSPEYLSNADSAFIALSS
jgi:hypothetical protein